jgi:superoxide reductase
MNKLSEYVKSADWKSEKHVPALEAPDTVKAGEWFNISVTVGKEIPHPNTTEHHIAWIAVHFAPTGAKATFEIGRFEFSAHGQSPTGPNQGPVYTDSGVVVRAKLNTSGLLFTTAYCNIHGLWEAERPIQVV